MNINQCSKRIKSKREGITYPLFLIETAKKFRAFLSKRRKRKKSSPLVSHFKWSLSGVRIRLTWFWAGCIWNYIATYLELRRDASVTASGRTRCYVGTQFREQHWRLYGKNSIKNTAKNHQKRLSIAIFMAIYGRLWQLKSYCNIGTFS